MNSKHINLKILDGQEEGVLEKIIRYIELARLKRAISEKARVDLESLIINIDKHIQDLNEINQKSSREIIEKIIALLKSLSSALDNSDFLKQELIFLHHFLNELNIALNSIEEIGVSNFYLILSKMSLELAFMPKIVINESHVTSLKNERLKIIEQNKRKLKIKSSPLEMEVFLSHKKDSVSLQTLAILIETLNSIEGTNVMIEELLKGSIISRLKIYFKSPDAKKQATELLESTKKFAIGKLEKEYIESEKLKKETEKIEVEKQQIVDAMSFENSADNIEKRSLEIEAIKLDNERKKLENQKLELDIFAQKTLILKQLLVEQLLSQEEFQILINKQLFIAKVEDTITTGSSISEIENK